MSGNLKKILFGIFGMSIILISLSVFVFWSFKTEEESNEKILIREAEKTNSPAEEPQVVSKVITLPDNKGKDKTDISISRKKINIYIIDEKGNNTMPIVTFVSPENFSPKTVAESVLLALGERVATGKIGAVKEDGSSIYIDLFAKEKEEPFGEVDAKTEELILDCISYSVLDNFSDFSNIYFTVNGEAYSSKNIKLQKDKPFINQ